MFGRLFSHSTETGSARNDPLPGPPVQKVWLEGCKFSDFKLGPILGTGSFGRVHLAHYIPTNQVCATKSLSKAMIVKSKQVAHVKQEKSILQRLSYPFIVNLIGCCQDDKCIHLVLEYICGLKTCYLMRGVTFGSLTLVLPRKLIEEPSHCVGHQTIWLPKSSSTRVMGNLLTGGLLGCSSTKCWQATLPSMMIILLAHTKRFWLEK